jgi:hypothetical protein
MSLKENIINECVNILKRDDIKKELKGVFSPFITLLLQEIYPYIFLTLMFVILVFLLILGIFIILLRSKNKAL